jgi:hypothetical protein
MEATANSAGLPYLNASMPRDVVGVKGANVTVTIRRRNGTESVTGEATDSLAYFASECQNGAIEMWGRPGELCLQCPQGAVCYGSLKDPISGFGWWQMNITGPARADLCEPERANRTWCPDFVPCEPEKACLGNNTCALGYDKIRCSECLKGKYYRLDGECIKCPNQPWVLVVGVIFAAVVLCTTAYVLNKKSVNIGMLAILIDYAQVLCDGLRLLPSPFRACPLLLHSPFPFLSPFAAASLLTGLRASRV